MCIFFICPLGVSAFFPGFLEGTKMTVTTLVLVTNDYLIHFKNSLLFISKSKKRNLVRMQHNYNNVQSWFFVVSDFSFFMATAFFLGLNHVNLWKLDPAELQFTSSEFKKQV